MKLFGFQSRSVQDKQRLEAFIDALPFEYCGWRARDIIVWSRGFPRLFGLTSLQSVRDIQSVILPSDAAALEGMIFALQKDGERFSLDVQISESGKTITLHGAKGQDLDGEARYDVLWAQDTSTQKAVLQDITDRADMADKALACHKAFINALPQSIWVTDHDGTVQWCNTAYATMMDHRREDLVNAPNRFHPTLNEDYKISLADMAQKAVETGERDNTTGRIILEGKRRLVDLHVTPETTYNKHIVFSAYDITEQEELRAQLKRYVTANAELLEKLTTAIAIFGSDQALEFYNHAFASLWGLEEYWLDSRPSLGDILEKLREMRRLPEQADFRSYKKSWLDHFTNLIKDRHEDMMHLPDGVAVRGTIVPHPMGGLMTTFEDVTSRLELESSYNTLVAVQQETLDNLSEGVAVFGSDARLKLCNPAYLSLWKLNPEDTAANPHISELIEKKKRFFSNPKTEWEAIKATFLAHVIDYNERHETITRRDGMILDCSAVPLPDGGMMVTYRDVTDSVNIREALEEKNRALTEAERLKTEFLANVSYQLRTPLNAISGFAEILNQDYFGSLNDKQREYTQGITDATALLSGLIDDILDLSSIEAGYMELKKKPVQIIDLLAHIYDLARDWAGMKHITVQFKKPRAKPPEITIDDTRIKQALMNIIRSAIHHTGANGTILIQLEKAEDALVVSIQDSRQSQRMEDDQNKIFDPFHDGSDNGLVRSGSGLGLSLARNIIDLHGGHVVAEILRDKTGESAGFMVTIHLNYDKQEA